MNYQTDFTLRVRALCLRVWAVLARRKLDEIFSSFERTMPK